MSKVRGWVAVLLGAAVVSAVGACGVQSGADPTEGCTDETRTAGEPGDGEPLLTLGSETGAPTIVYSDGAVVIPTESAADLAAGAAAGHLQVPMMMPGYSGEEPGGFTAGWLSECELEAVTGLADDLLVEGVDFGEPIVTDSGSTSVTYGDFSTSIYAFSRTDPSDWGGLSDRQNQARQDLADLWDVVDNATELTDELPIDRLFIRFYGSISDDEVTDWPLEAPISELSQNGCATVADAADIEALLDRLDSGEELLEDTDWRLAVVAAAPGVSDCEG
ncbi:hypothetical protein [Pseudactinotalea sp.]|uniref:hypothetical protein n=1 Tax=Pseudactinotalea sp. TaxID=1926260 RepID=UPI003B3A9C7B